MLLKYGSQNSPDSRLYVVKRHFSRLRISGAVVFASTVSGTEIVVLKVSITEEQEIEDTSTT